MVAELIGEFGEDDASSEIGARRLAGIIADYWRARGFHGISTGAIPALVPLKEMRRHVKGIGSTYDTRPIWRVVSNIGPRGYPPRAAAA